MCTYFPSLALHGKLKQVKKKSRTTTGTATFFVHVLSKKKKSRYNIITHQNSVVDPDPNSIRSSEKNKFQLYRYRTQSFFLQENGKDIKNMMGESGSPTLESLILLVWLKTEKIAFSLRKGRNITTSALYKKFSGNPENRLSLMPQPLKVASGKGARFGSS